MRTDPWYNRVTQLTEYQRFMLIGALIGRIENCTGETPTETLNAALHNINETALTNPPINA